MDPRSGQIVEVVNELEANSRKLIPIPDDEIQAVTAMGTDDRKAWALKQLLTMYPDSGNRKQRRGNAALRRQALKHGDV